MIVLEMEKNLFKRYVHALTSDDKIEVGPENWNDNNLLVLAGCCVHLFERRNPQPSPPQDGQRQQKSAEPDSLAEHRPNRDLVTALRVVCEHANFAMDDDFWDNYLNEVVYALIDHVRFGEAGVKFIGGVKGRNQ